MTESEILGLIITSINNKEYDTEYLRVSMEVLQYEPIYICFNDARFENTDTIIAIVANPDTGRCEVSFNPRYFCTDWLDNSTRTLNIIRDAFTVAMRIYDQLNVLIQEMARIREGQ